MPNKCHVVILFFDAVFLVVLATEVGGMEVFVYFLWILFHLF